jgi:hypothetical protein
MDQNVFDENRVQMNEVKKWRKKEKGWDEGNENRCKNTTTRWQNLGTNRGIMKVMDSPHGIESYPAVTAAAPHCL